VAVEHEFATVYKFRKGGGISASEPDVLRVYVELCLFYHIFTDVFAVITMGSTDSSSSLNSTHSDTRVDLSVAVPLASTLPRIEIRYENLSYNVAWPQTEVR
jgi:hypothetical protein